MKEKAHVIIVLSELPEGNHVARIMGHGAGKNGGPVDPMDLFRVWFLLGEAIKARVPLAQREFLGGVSMAMQEFAEDMTRLASQDIAREKLS